MKHVRLSPPRVHVVYVTAFCHVVAKTSQVQSTSLLAGSGSMAACDARFSTSDLEAQYSSVNFLIWLGKTVQLLYGSFRK